MTQAGLVAGTLVHVKAGQLPIEQIKVGDWVLSKHESGEGERAYKRVVRTWRYEGREVCALQCTRQSSANEPFTLVGTSNQRLRVEESARAIRRWTRMDHLGGVEELQLAAGSTARVTEPAPVYVTANGAVGWTPLNSRADAGWMLDFRDTPLQTGIEPVYNHGVEWWEPEGRFTTTVYNLEVEDFPTYFVGEIGVWVHSMQGASNADASSPR